MTSYPLTRCHDQLCPICYPEATPNQIGADLDARIREDFAGGAF